jgi:hypothetical protein
MIDVLFFGRMADIMRQRRLRQDLASDCQTLYGLRLWLSARFNPTRYA